MKRKALALTTALALVVFVFVCQCLRPTWHRGRTTYSLLPLREWGLQSIVWDGFDPATMRQRSGTADWYGPLERDTVTWQGPLRSNKPLHPTPHGAPLRHEGPAAGLSGYRRG